MNISKIAQKFIGIALVLIFLTGCATSTVAPTSIPTFPMPTQPNTPLPPPPIPTQPVQPTQATLFRFIQTIQVTPDDNYLGGGFVRINYIPATNRFVVTFAATIAQPQPPNCLVDGYAYKLYTLDMQTTGETSVFSCPSGDSGSLMVDNTFYFVIPTMKPNGWHVVKFDATTWTMLAKTRYSFDPQVDTDTQPNNDPMVAFVNGQLDISSQYNAAGHPPDLTLGAATFHDFFSTDLAFLNQRILNDTPHILGSSMIFLDGLYYFVTANAYLGGDIVVITYDQNWKYVGVKSLVHNGLFSTGLAFDGQRFYIVYLDNSQTLKPNQLPVYLNVRLAAFDRNWNLLDDIAVTSYAISDNMQTGRPWVLLHGNRLYVSYDLDTMDPVTRSENKHGQAIISIFELNQTP